MIIAMTCEKIISWQIFLGSVKKEDFYAFLINLVQSLNDNFEKKNCFFF